MGIYLIAGGNSEKTKRTVPKSDDIYLISTCKSIYRFLVRRTGSHFNAAILKRLFIFILFFDREEQSRLKRLFMSKANKAYSLSLSRLIRFMGL
ncbi:hypothetical protein MKX03_008818 [Papaver bracteatum]|nr:hypothetical protein MKX03_008818 [Papaver bracteatum]